MNVWKARPEVLSSLYTVQEKFHPHLNEARFAICFNDARSFVKDRFNWGRTGKFSSLSKLFHSDEDKSDFLIQVPMETWEILQGDQRDALLDLHLCRCKVELKPLFVTVNGKKQPAKDELGRVQYSDEVKTDDEGNPKWVVTPFDLNVLIENVSHFGCWCNDLLDFRSVIREVTA
jgi:Putative phage metallopeptidase